MRIATRWRSIPIASAAVLSLIGFTFVQGAKEVGGEARAAIPLQSNACLIASDFYRVNPPSPIPQARLYDINAANGASSNSRLANAPGVIGLAWGPGAVLYGVSTFDNTAGYQANSMYRINPAGGATLIGPVGVSGMGDGDMATHPVTGEVYAISGSRLMRFPGLSANVQSATAVTIGNVAYPFANSTWDFSGLAFNAVGQLFILGQAQGMTGPNAKLIRIDPATATVIGTPVTLSQRFHGIGGLEFHNGALYFAEGHEPGQFNGSNSNNLYNLFQINPSTGAVTPKGSTNILGGVSSLVSCTPPPSITPACVPPPPDMDAWYPMDGNGNDRILAKNAVASGGPVTYGAGKVAQAVTLNGASMTVASGPVLNQGLGDFSIDAWIYFPASAPGVRSVIDKRTDTGGQTRGWALFTYDGRPSLQLADGSHSNYADPRAAGPGWRHITVTVDRDNPQGIVFYIDGVAGTPMNPTARQGNLDNSAPTSFGRHSIDGTTNPSLGLDEVEFFDRVLKPAEIMGIYQAGPSGKCK